jgi:hypothetical protein
MGFPEGCGNARRINSKSSAKWFTYQSVAFRCHLKKKAKFTKPGENAQNPSMRVDRPVFNLLLNPTDTLFVGGDDPDLVKFEEPGKVVLLSRLIPAEKAFDHPTHGLEIEVAGEDEVFTARCSKSNLRFAAPLGFCTF